MTGGREQSPAHPVHALVDEPHRQRQHDPLVVLDDTLYEHWGRLFNDVDRHDHHSDNTYRRAHHPVTNFSGSGLVRFPIDLRLYHRYEALTQWEAAVAKHYPDIEIPMWGLSTVPGRLRAEA